MLEARVLEEVSRVCWTLLEEVKSIASRVCLKKLEGVESVVSRKCWQQLDEVKSIPMASCNVNISSVASLSSARQSERYCPTPPNPNHYDVTKDISTVASV